VNEIAQAATQLVRDVTEIASALTRLAAITQEISDRQIAQDEEIRALSNRIEGLRRSESNPVFPRPDGTR
jgi:hypothetical protein